MFLKICFIILLLIIHNLNCAKLKNFESLAKLAFDHGSRINEDGACKHPRPQLVYFNDPSKVYLPRATILHRCSDVTGCCPHASQTCQPLETQSIELYFFTVSLIKTNTRQVHQHQNIDKMSFVNHTKCGCRNRPGYETVDTSLFDVNNEL